MFVPLYHAFIRAQTTIRSHTGHIRVQITGFIGELLDDVGHGVWVAGHGSHETGFPLLDRQSQQLRCVIVTGGCYPPQSLFDTTDSVLCYMDTSIDKHIVYIHA